MRRTTWRKPCVSFALQAVLLASSVAEVGAADATESKSTVDPSATQLVACRTAPRRQELTRAHGGTDASEAAVEAALGWLVAHQHDDGGWSFDHAGGKCQGRCRNPGSLKEARLTATGLALLPLLGAGHTDSEGEHRE